MPAYRALQNPGLFKYDHYRQAALAVCAGILIRFLIAVPVRGEIDCLENMSSAANNPLNTDHCGQSNAMVLCLFCRLRFRDLG